MLLWIVAHVLSLAASAVYNVVTVPALHTKRTEKASDTTCALSRSERDCTAAGPATEDENGMASSAHVMDDSAAVNGTTDSAKSQGTGGISDTGSPRQLADTTNLQQRPTAPGTQPTGQTKLVSATSAGVLACCQLTTHCFTASRVLPRVVTDCLPLHSMLCLLCNAQMSLLPNIQKLDTSCGIG